MVSARLARLRRHLREALNDFLKHVEKHYHRLESAEADAARKVVAELIGTDSQLRSGVRLQLLSRAAARAPLLCFPYRSFLGLLSLTAGALDRLLLAFTGSLPSLAMVALQTGRNIRQLQRMRDHSRQGVRRRADELAAAQIDPVNRVFLRAVEQALPEEARPRLRRVPREAHLEGMEEMESESFRIFESRLDRHGLSSRLIGSVGWFATLVFWFLLAGPICAVYREYLAVWKVTFAGQAVWFDYPAPSAGMVFATLLLVIAPVFVLAVVTLGLGCYAPQCRRKKCRSCAEVLSPIKERL